MKSKTDDFSPLTLLEIEDIANLIKALLKINIDIAHREYFLKIDIPMFKESGTEEWGWWYGYKNGSDWISFEPTVEFKFSNFHAANQVDNGKLICTVSGTNAGVDPSNMWIIPVNRELLSDANTVHNAKQFNDFWYYYDYKNSLEKLQKVRSASPNDTYDQVTLSSLALTGWQYYYAIKPLYLYENSTMQSPVDVNGFIRKKVGASTPIPRGLNQIRTFMSVLKKYRPIIMPDVRSIFNDCQNNNTKYEADLNNDYGIFGWCTIPSKTMVNMEYNEESIIVPSSYDHHNRIGGANFLQMDKDFDYIYKKWVGDKNTGHLETNINKTWYYLYNTRDWTYFLLPFFNVKQNSELYSYMLDTYGPNDLPENSNHINGVIFEPSNEGRDVDTTFGGIAETCKFLAKYHHNENNLKILAERYTKLISYQRLKELTAGESGTFNSVYGSAYSSLPTDFKFPFEDWIDDYDKTGSYVGLKLKDYSTTSTSSALKYTYNLGQAHAIDDFDEDSVWFYITMVSPIENLEQVIEIKDIMPFVFWWENRGSANNGPTVDCYGLKSSSKLNYEQGGWCYSGAHERVEEIVSLNAQGNIVTTPGSEIVEQKWHAVQHTLGTDFSKDQYGGAILTSDNSGNVYKGAFDPHCIGTDEKWKIHHMSNSFGTNQHEDPVPDKYHIGHRTHGLGDFKNEAIPSGMNDGIIGPGSSLRDRTMAWNLWNVIRHYVYIKYFKNKHIKLGNDTANWQQLEKYTKKIVKSIYRTFYQNRLDNTSGRRNNFTDIDEVSTYYGGTCYVPWANSFAEISTILERNAREHLASFVLFTGDLRENDALANSLWSELYGSASVPQAVKNAHYIYTMIRRSTLNFRVLTLDGADAEDDGMIPRR